MFLFIKENNKIIYYVLYYYYRKCYVMNIDFFFYEINRILWFVFEGCLDMGYYNGLDCCLGVNCVNCDLEVGVCLECKFGY